MTALSQPLLIVCWDMELSFQEELAFAAKTHDHLPFFATHTHSLILCPSLLNIYQYARIFSPHNYVKIGAQLISQHTIGLHRGEESAQSLAEAGCSYALVSGHEPLFVRKVSHLINNNITPIITLSEKNLVHSSVHELEKQLEPLITHLRTQAQTDQYHSLVFAYQPLPQTNITHTETLLAWLFNYLFRSLPHTGIKLVLGPTLPENYHQMRFLPHISGIFLDKIGTNFQELKKIVESLYSGPQKTSIHSMENNSCY